MADSSWAAGSCSRDARDGSSDLSFRGVPLSDVEKQTAVNLTLESMRDLIERGSQRYDSLDNEKVASYHADAFVSMAEQYIQCGNDVHKIARNNHIGYMSKQVVEAFHHERAPHSGEVVALVRAIVQRMIAASIDQKVLPRSLSENVEAIRGLLTTVCCSVMTAVLIQGGSGKTPREHKNHEVCMPCDAQNQHVALRARIIQNGTVVCTSDSPTMDKICKKANTKTRAAHILLTVMLSQCAAPDGQERFLFPMQKQHKNMWAILLPNVYKLLRDNLEPDAIATIRTSLVLDCLMKACLCSELQARVLQTVVSADAVKTSVENTKQGIKMIIFDLPIQNTIMTEALKQSFEADKGMASGFADVALWNALDHCIQGQQLGRTDENNIEQEVRNVIQKRKEQNPANVVDAEELFDKCMELRQNVQVTFQGGTECLLSNMAFDADAVVETGQTGPELSEQAREILDVVKKNLLQIENGRTEDYDTQSEVSDPPSHDDPRPDDDSRPGEGNPGGEGVSAGVLPNAVEADRPPSSESKKPANTPNSSGQVKERLQEAPGKNDSEDDDPSSFLTTPKDQQDLNTAAAAYLASEDEQNEQKDRSQKEEKGDDDANERFRSQATQVALSLSALKRCDNTHLVKAAKSAVERDPEMQKDLERREQELLQKIFAFAHPNNTKKVTQHFKKQIVDEFTVSGCWEGKLRAIDFYKFQKGKDMYVHRFRQDGVPGKNDPGATLYQQWYGVEPKNAKRRREETDEGAEVKGGAPRGKCPRRGNVKSTDGDDDDKKSIPLDSKPYHGIAKGECRHLVDGKGEWAKLDDDGGDDEGVISSPNKRLRRIQRAASSDSEQSVGVESDDEPALKKAKGLKGFGGVGSDDESALMKQAEGLKGYGFK